jgi:hypothetical protein
MEFSDIDAGSTDLNLSADNGVINCCFLCSKAYVKHLLHSLIIPVLQIAEKMNI